MPAPARAVLICALLLLGLTVTNAGLAVTVTPDLQRAEVLAGMASVALMLVAVLWTRANPKSAEKVSLTGEQGLVLSEQLNDLQKQELAWGSHMLLTATPAASVLVVWRQQVVLRRGLISQDPFQPGAITKRAMDREQTISLVNTTLFPGRAEFDGMLQSLPAILVCPMGQQGVVILGGWSPRCFSRSDERWLEGWAQRLRTTLEAEDASSRS
ncbi:cofactor assembly of complex C subunit B [Synechococcus sp. HB1133]|uniref:cofactor assembly of complex C subunit B n=1 Tax=unclassified Synechococcus TaxID=2626047 RepID=UPI00140A6C83|nr:MULTISPECIES: cofactor assembly of complex C subunit B [unclassified Synechococcus]MCB4394953.1 cofactor assembly of complex C subunit B [Synechococcus sp. PH41509]MCB4421853.1 cofactor assembly of complex C subunit B [Synechococcus sp. HB1133]MCB4430200.1 cofactor assembly of complex C subunit B [Synechococcus sp. HBA1120]NHI80795.1 cofactor assembly of complex C subunit B [Synechococcus sp. HB1133]